MLLHPAVPGGVQHMDRKGHQTAPGPSTAQFLLLLADLLRDAPNVMLRLFGKYGDVVCVGNKRLRRLYLLNHPRHIKHVLQDNYLNYGKGSLYDELRTMHGDGLVTAEGEAWQRQRRQAQPAFYHDHDERFARIIIDATAAMLDRWPAIAEAGRALDIRDEMRNLTLEILLQCLFSTHLAADANTLCPALDTAENRINPPSSLNPLKPLLKRLPTPANLRLRKALRRIDSFAYRMIAERRRCPGQNRDLLSLLLAAEKSGRVLDDQHIRDAMITLVDSGYDSTANAITWAWYLLSRNPAVGRTQHAELTQVLRGRTPSFQDLPQLTYTRMVVQETLRLYPSAWAIARTAINDDEIDGYWIPAKSIVVMSPYTAHRRPASWENPEGFDPERFGCERSQGREQFAYFPFGGGPRVCLGKRFALMEAELVLATVAQKWRLDLVPGPPIGTKPTISLRPRRRIMMTLHSQPKETRLTHRDLLSLEQPLTR
jgi:enediyne biosynthesis protein E7